MDFTTNPSNSNAAASTTKSQLLIKVRSDFVSTIAKTSSTVEFGPLIHEMCHIFQNRQDWNFDWGGEIDREITVLLVQAIIADGKQIMNDNGSIILSSNIEYFNHRSQHAATSDYKLYNEIAYKILTKTSISAVQFAITSNNGNTVSSNLERFEKFADTIKSTDIREIELSNGKTLYEYLGGTVENKIKKLNLLQGNKKIIENGEITENKLDWDGDAFLAIELELSSNDELISVGLTGYEFDDNDLTLRKITDVITVFEQNKDGEYIAKLTIKTKKTGTTTIEIPIENVPEDTTIISRVRGSMSTDSKYYIYVYLDENRDTKYGINWCKEHITIVEQNTNKLKLSNAMSVTGNENAIAFEVKNVSDITGETFTIDVLVKDNSDNIIDSRLNVKIEIEDEEIEDYQLLITNQSHLSDAQSYFGDAYEYAVSSTKFSFPNNPDFEFWKTNFNQTNENKKTDNIFCAAKGWHMSWNSYYHTYNSKTKTIEPLDQYALIYLNEKEYQNGEDAKYYAIQAYVWTRNTLNSGDVLTLNDIEDTYVVTIQKAIAAAEEAVKNGGTLTLDDGRKVQVEDFTLTYFDLQSVISISSKRTIKFTDNYFQPFLTFDYKLKDGPEIQLEKVNEDGKYLSGAKFRVAHRNLNSSDTWTYDSKKDEYVTKENGLTDKITLEKGQEYFIYEIKAPDTYEPTKQYAIIEVNEDGTIISWTIYQANENAIDENGYVKSPNGTKIEENNADWKTGELEENSSIDLIYTITNKSELIITPPTDDGGEVPPPTVDIPTPPDIQIQKVDENGKPLAGARFAIITKNIESGIEYTIYEYEAPEGYKPSTQFVKLTLKNGKYTYEVYQANKECINANGYITGTPEGELITRSSEYEWKEITSKENGTIKIYLQVVNKEANMPKLNINKTDENKQTIDGTVEFKVYVDEKCTQELGTITITNGKSTTLWLPEMELKQEARYYIKETVTPIGYKQIEDIMILDISTNEKGEISAELDGKPLTLNGNQITLNIVNETIKVEKIQLKIKKVDGSSNTLLSGATFTVTGDIKNNNGSYTGTTNSSGILGPIEFRDLEIQTEYKVTITETQQPENYKENKTPIVISIYVKEDGTISSPTLESTNNIGLSLTWETLEDGTVEITVTVKNYKDIETLEIPLLMYMEGTVWLDGVSGKESESNSLLGDDVDKNLAGILVELYDAETGQLAEVADYQDVKDAIDYIEGKQKEYDNTYSGGKKDESSYPKNESEWNARNEAINNAKENVKTKIDELRKYLATNFIYNTPERLKSANDLLQKYYNIIGEVNDNKITDKDGTGIFPYNYDLVNKQYESNIYDAIENYYNAQGKKIATNYAGIEYEENSIVYEELLNSNAINILKTHASRLEELQKQGKYNTTVTNKNGYFAFYGLNPDKNYIVKFTYNGMLYKNVELTYSLSSNLSGDTLTRTSKATENQNERQELIERFKEIGTYPYNYKTKTGKWNTVFSNDEVKQKIENVTTIEDVKQLYLGNTSNSTNSNNESLKSIEQFIKDTTVSASTEPIGGILKDAENKVKQTNRTFDTKTQDMVYPVVKMKEILGEELTFEKVAIINGVEESLTVNGFNTEDEARAKYNQMLKEDKTIVGYIIEEYEYGQLTHTSYPPDPSDPCGVKNNIPKHNHKEVSVIGIGTNLFKRITNYKSNTDKTIDFLTFYRISKNTCTVNYTDPSGKPASVSLEYNTITSFSQKGTYYTLKVFYMGEGYNTTEENKIKFAKFTQEGEAYFTSDKNEQGKYDDYLNGTFNMLDGKKTDCTKSYVNFGKEISTNYGWGANEERTVASICEDLLENIEQENKDHGLSYANFGVKYRPTMDLGLYNDVQNAYVEINGKSETYVYDKRAANGGSFQFGVNAYDLGSRYNEEQYSTYYKNLSNGTNTTNANNMNELTYTNYLRKEDIEPNSVAGSTDTGTADAGGYNDYPITIKLTYKIRIINQSNVVSGVTEIVDYYSSDFEVTGVYANEEKTQTVDWSTTSTYSNRGTKQSAPSGYNTIYIRPLNTMLSNNQSQYIYVELTMKTPKITLIGKIDSGYETLNYAEINGYTSNEGVLDIDSIPGNIIDDGKGRFNNGTYEDDEGKSPTFIFKNPENSYRTITGTFFEDVTSSEETQTKSSRNGDGQLNDSEDTPVVGGVVRLIELDSSGNMLYNSNLSAIRAETETKEDGSYTFTKIIPGNYLIQFEYGGNYKTVLTKVSGTEYQNEKSYNGQDYENTIRVATPNSNSVYWYANDDARNSDASDDVGRRSQVVAYATTLNNEKAEIFNSWKDSVPNMTLVEALRTNTNMNAKTNLMSLEVEFIETHPNRVVTEINEDGTYDNEYTIENIDFGIVERERAELEITKTVSEISIKDSSGNLITGGKAGENIEYVKWIQGAGGFVGMEIDKELLSGATLEITYAITVTNNSETSTENANTISDIKVIDYVSNNLNYDENYGVNNTINKSQGWELKTIDQIEQYINEKSRTTEDSSNKIDLTTYQTILLTDFGTLSPGEHETKTLTLKKNLSAQEDSDFNYENQVEIVYSTNASGRGDYSSIYGNLDPLTYTSRQGNLNWDYVSEEDASKYPQQPTVTELDEAVDNPNAIRLAEKDSGNAEEVTITPPTGRAGIVLQTQHYILALISLLSILGLIVLIKKYIVISKE